MRAASPLDLHWRWALPAASGLLVLGAQLWLVARAGTDIPFFDQWDVEGRLLFPAWLDGSLAPAQLLAAHNEHRILWTRLLELGLFATNGRWDPLVELAVNALLHAGVAALLVTALAPGFRRAPAIAITAAVVLLNLPVLGWHNALWGFQSQVYFCLLFALGALAVLAPAGRSAARAGAGALLAIAAMFAMGAGLLAPIAVTAIWAWRGERRAWAWAGLAALVGLGVVLQADVPAHAALRSASPGDFFTALRQVLAWPARGAPWMALMANLPLAAFVAGRALRRLPRSESEEFVLAVALWGLLVAGATAWSRGGGGEFLLGVPSRYADFLGLLPLVNGWCVLALWRAAAPMWRLALGGWTALVVLTLLGSALQDWRGVIAPRCRDREAPVRLVRAFQQSGDPAVFAGQPRLYLAHPEPAVVAAVLKDARLAGRLPPSLQPEQPPGPLSRAVRWLLRR